LPAGVTVLCIDLIKHLL